MFTLLQVLRVPTNSWLFGRTIRKAVVCAASEIPFLGFKTAERFSMIKTFKESGLSTALLLPFVGRCVACDSSPENVFPVAGEPFFESSKIRQCGDASFRQANPFGATSNIIVDGLNELLVVLGKPPQPKQLLHKETLAMRESLIS
jgi:hypothetical protein